MSNELLSTREVAQILGVERSTVTRWVRIGQLKPAQTIHENRAYLFRRSQIERLADKHERRRIAS